MYFKVNKTITFLFSCSMRVRILLMSDIALNCNSWLLLKKCMLRLLDFLQNFLLFWLYRLRFPWRNIDSVNHWCGSVLKNVSSYFSSRHRTHYFSTIILRLLHIRKSESSPLWRQSAAILTPADGTSSSVVQYIIHNG